MLTADGLDSAFLGIGRRCGQPDVAVYSIERAVFALERDGMTADEAREYLEFNSIGAWVGDETPVWLEEMSLTEAREALEEADGP